MLKISFLIFFTFGCVATAAPFKRASRLHYQGNLEILGAYLYRDKAKNNFNSGNRVLEIPTHSLLTDTRAEARINFGEDFRFIVRPRFQFDYKILGQSFPDEERKIAKGKADLSDAYFDANLSEDFVLACGLHSYQWGPGEILSPSNPIFHFESNQKGFLFKQKGKGLVRANFSPNPDWTLIWMSEVFDNLEEKWTAEDGFEMKHLLKIEMKLDNAANYIGVSTGTESKQHFFLGEYANWSPVEGYSLYVDMRHTKGAHFFQPQLNPLGSWDMMPANEQTDQYFTLGVFGFRFEDRFDLRAEYIYNALGFDSTEMDHAYASTLNPLTLTYQRNLQRFARTGLELQGREYLYLSLRIPDLGPKSNISFAIRSIYSKQDSSSQSVISVEKPLTDSLVGDLEFSQSLGREVSEFMLADRYSVLVGGKWSL